MTWESAVRSHHAWVTCDGAREDLSAEDWPDDADVRDVVDRTRWVLEHVKARFERSDPREVSTATLDSLNAQFSQVRSLLVNLRTSSANVPNLHQWCDTTLGAVASWPHPKANSTVGTVRRVATEYRTDIERVLAEHAKVVAQMSDEIREAKTSFSTETFAMTASVQAILKRVEAQAGRLDQNLDGLANRFEEAETARVASAEKAATKREADFATERQRAAVAVDAQIADLDAMREQARATLQAIGVDSTASHYGTYAKQQRTAAFGWSVFTVLLGVAGALGVVWALHSASITDASWQLISLKSISSTVLLGVAGYAGAQASGHRREERRARRIELGLAALDPFLATVDGDEVKTLRLALGAELFAAPPGKDHDRSSSPLQVFQRSLTNRAITARVEASAGTKDAPTT